MSVQILQGFTRSAVGRLIRSKNDTRLHIGGVQFEAVCTSIKQAKKGRNLLQRKIENAQNINRQNAKSLERMGLNYVWSDPMVQTYLTNKGYAMDFRAFEQKYKRQAKFRNDINNLI